MMTTNQTIDAMAPSTPSHNATSAVHQTPASSSAAGTDRPTISTRLSTGPDVPDVLNTTEYLPTQEDIGNAASTVVGTARGHLPGQEDMKSAPCNVKETTKQFLPEKGPANLPDSETTATSTSLPTAEVSGAQSGEKTGGVGALPGPLSESGVAILPEERSKHLAVRDGVGGVGTLSWAGSENSIAKLPEEKNVTRAIPASTGEIPGTSKETKNTEQDTNGNDIRNEMEEVRDDRITERHNGKYGDDYHPAQDRPADKCTAEKTSSQHTSSRNNGSGVVTQSVTHEAPGSNTSHKPKFMDRVKGEAKILVGKLEGSDEKVEEGRRMMGKET